MPKVTSLVASRRISNVLEKISPPAQRRYFGSIMQAGIVLDRMDRSGRNCPRVVRAIAFKLAQYYWFLNGKKFDFLMRDVTIAENGQASIDGEKFDHIFGGEVLETCMEVVRLLIKAGDDFKQMPHESLMMIDASAAASSAYKINTILSFPEIGQQKLTAEIWHDVSAGLVKIINFLGENIPSNTQGAKIGVLISDAVEVNSCLRQMCMQLVERIVLEKAAIQYRVTSGDTVGDYAE